MAALSLTDISQAIRNSKVCLRVPNLKDATPKTHDGRLVCYSGNYGAVFQYDLSAGGSKAVRVWTKDLDLLPELPNQAKLISEHIKSLDSKYFSNFDYVEKGLLVRGALHPVVIMDWQQGQNLKDYIAENLHRKQKLIDLASNFLSMVSWLHDRKISHGDLQHGNILVDADGNLRLIDYDSLYLPQVGLEGRRESIKGLPSYQHPARHANEYMNERVDYFSELIIYVSIVAIANDSTLWERYNVINRDYSLLFDASDFSHPESSAIYKDLLGISPTMAKLVKCIQNELRETDINKLKPLEDVISFLSLEIQKFVTSSSAVNDTDWVSLSWETKNATYVSLNGVRVAASGTKELPAEEEYTLRAKNDFDTIEKTIKIKVIHPLSVSSFEPDSTEVRADSLCKIHWEGRNVDYITVDGARFIAADPISFVPQRSGTHTAEFIGLDGTHIKKEFALTIVYPAPRVKLHTPPFAKPNEEVSILWESKYVDHVVIDGVVRQKNDSYQWTYSEHACRKTLIFHGQDGKEHKKVVEIRKAQPAAVHTCELSQKRIKEGDKCTLTWGGEHVVGWSIEGIGKFDPEEKTKTFVPRLELVTAHFTGEDGSVIHKEIRIEILHKPIVGTCKISPSAPIKGEPCKIEWTSQYVTKVEIDGKTFAQNDSYTFTPEKNQIVVLNFYGESGECISRRVGITLPPMVIDSCIADPNPVRLGEPCTIRWQATNADKVEIKGKDYYSKGTHTFTPTSSERVEVKFYGDDGSTVTRCLMVNVTYPPAEVESLQISPSKVKPGEQVTLIWKSKYVRSVSINSGTYVKNGLPACGEQSFTINANSNFRVSFHGEDGNTVTKIVTAQIIPSPNINDCCVDKDKIKKGETCKISWSSDNVSHVTVKGQRYQATDSVTYVPQKSESIRVTFHGEDGSTKYKTVSVEVVKPSRFFKILLSLLLALILLVGADFSINYKHNNGVYKQVNQHLRLAESNKDIRELRDAQEDWQRLHGVTFKLLKRHEVVKVFDSVKGAYASFPNKKIATENIQKIEGIKGKL